MWDRLFRRERLLRVALGTAQVTGVYRALDETGQPYEVVGEARSTGALYSLLPQAQLVVVDRGDLAEIGPGWELLEAVLAQRLHLSSAEFLDQPLEWVQQARRAAGHLEALPARTVVLTACAGGTGRTTLAGALARAFRQRTNLPVALVEVGHGASALAALHNLGPVPTFYDVAMKQAAPAQHEGVTVVPMLRDLADRVPEPVRVATLRRLQEGHVLTVLDVAWPHSYRAALLDGLLGEVLWLVTATPQADKLANQTALVDRLQDEALGSVLRVLNAVQSRDRLALAGLERDVTLPHVGGDKAGLGKTLLAQVYPGLKV